MRVVCVSIVWALWATLTQGYLFPGEVTFWVSREFSQMEAFTSDTIVVTFQFVNGEPEAVSSFYYSDEIPSGVSVIGEKVRINGIEVWNLIRETDCTGCVYPGCVAHRWVLDVPQGDSLNNHIPSDGTLSIEYSFPCNKPGVYVFPSYNWVGGLKTSPLQATFGYGPLQYILVRRPGTSCGDCNGDGSITIADVVYLSAYVYREGFPPLGEADVNVDGRVTVADCVYLNAYLYAGGPGPCEL